MHGFNFQVLVMKMMQYLQPFTKIFNGELQSFHKV